MDQIMPSGRESYETIRMVAKLGAKHKRERIRSWEHRCGGIVVDGFLFGAGGEQTLIADPLFGEPFCRCILHAIATPGQGGRRLRRELVML
jgi:hypothetical protein